MDGAIRAPYEVGRNKMKALEIKEDTNLHDTAEINYAWTACFQNGRSSKSKVSYELEQESDNPNIATVLVAGRSLKLQSQLEDYKVVGRSGHRAGPRFDHTKSANGEPLLLWRKSKTWMT